MTFCRRTTKVQKNCNWYLVCLAATAFLDQYRKENSDKLDVFPRLSSQTYDKKIASAALFDRTPHWRVSFMSPHKQLEKENN